jgi:uncharacterized paraquat-inducible protein A
MKGWIGGVLEVSRKDYLPPIFSSNINNLEAWYVFGPASHRPMSRKQLHKLFKCPHCEASYEVTYARVHVRDKDNAICKVCKKEMDRWHSTTYPNYTLLKKSASDS